MKISFFTEDNCIDKSAIGGGVYFFELVDIRTGKSIPLYVGESVWVMVRCSHHLYKLKQTKGQYFGLLEDDLNNDGFELKVTLLEQIDKLKSENDNRTFFKNRERYWITVKNPITQSGSSDNMIRSFMKKKKIVQTAMVEKGFK